MSVHARARVDGTLPERTFLVASAESMVTWSLVCEKRKQEVG